MKRHSNRLDARAHTGRRASPFPTVARRALVMLATAGTLAACEVRYTGDSSKKQDTTVIAPSPSAATPTRGDSSRDSGAAAAMAGVPAVPRDSAGATRDSGTLELYPPQPRRGGVLFAFARGLAMTAPRCTWRGAPLPCYASSGGVLATVPLPADDSAGTYQLTIDRPMGRIARQIVVADHDFGRELIFLDRPHYELATRGADIARDARAIRGILSGESSERRWSGRWKEPLAAGRSSLYGVERFYYPATDSTRAITLDPRLRTRGAFASDTSVPAASDAPSWRHAGTDIPAKVGAVVTAPASGTVADIGDYLLSGRTLLLDHGQGVYSAYFHLDTVLVQKGDVVRLGRPIARVGVSGLVTGPHLHYGIYLHGRDVDPAAWRDMPAFARGDTATLQTASQPSTKRGHRAAPRP